VKLPVAAFDLESHLFQPGLACPPAVCGSVATADGARLLSAQAALDWYRENLGRARIVGANIAYDNSLMVTMDPSLMRRVFAAYERGDFSDVQVRAMLNHIGHGWVEKDFFRDPRTGGVLMDPSKGKKAGRMSLATVLYLATGKVDAKDRADYRLKYATLEGVPMEQWPASAREYPLDDVRNTLEAWQVQEGEVGLEEPYLNLGNEVRQLRAAWAIRLASVWGLRTDAAAVQLVTDRVSAALDESFAKYQEAGFRRGDGTEDTRKVAAAVARAYGDSQACPGCQGTGQVLHEKQPVRETTARRWATHKDCCGTGIRLMNSPRTDAGNIKADRDTLEESGDEVLEKYAWVSNDEKVKGTYLPVLRRATRVPLNPEGNVLLSTGRASYDGIIQLIPRGGGLRECFIPREGYVYCSIDYNALELSTLAQVCLWVVGWSQMAEAINDGLDLHTKFAASMIGESYEAMLKLVKAGDKKAKGYRQAAKAANFGLPGGMGAPKLVVTQRKIGLRFCITLGEAPLCDCGGQKNCRRCHGRGALCGTEMIYQWNGRECPPVCKRCCELADQLKSNWMRQWPEIRPYFNHISRATKGGRGVLEQFVSRRVRGGVDFCNGANTLFQGLAADGAKHALWLVSKESYCDEASDMYGARPVIFVHDEIFSELPRGIAARAAERMTTVMIDGMSEFVPDVRIGAEPTLMDRWYKAAECARVPTAKGEPPGKLLVWVPGVKTDGAVIHRHYDAATGEVFEQRKTA
jgi:DNA polymerase-1